MGERSSFTGSRSPVFALFGAEVNYQLSLLAKIDPQNQMVHRAAGRLSDRGCFLAEHDKEYSHK
jgi:hypothetical protein